LLLLSCCNQNLAPELKNQELFEHKKPIEIFIDKLAKKLNIEKDITITLLKEQIKQYEKTIVELQNKLENVAIQGVKKPSSTTNNILRIENLTDEWLKQSSQNLNSQQFQPLIRTF
jgi:glutamine synthetase type III